MWEPRVSSPQETELRRQTGRRARRTGLLSGDSLPCPFDFSRCQCSESHVQIGSSHHEFAAVYTGQKPTCCGLPRLATHVYNGGCLVIICGLDDAVCSTSREESGTVWCIATAADSLEGAWSLSTGNLVLLSEQQFVDCDSWGSGCNGGFDAERFRVCRETLHLYRGELPVQRNRLHVLTFKLHSGSLSLSLADVTVSRV